MRISTGILVMYYKVWFKTFIAGRSYDTNIEKKKKTIHLQ